MQKIKTKCKEYGFNWGHAQLLSVAVVLFAVLVYTQSDINFKTLFAKADKPTEVVTYESARSVALADLGYANTDAANLEAEKQLALLDRSLENGEVLGAISGLGETPDADSIFTPDALAQIAVKTIANPSAADFEEYTRWVERVETQQDLLTLLANINSNDDNLIKDAKQRSIAIVQNFAAIPVPENLTNYHRYKMLYYTTLSNIGEVWLGERSETDLQPQSTVLFSVMSKLEATKSQYKEDFGVELQ